MSKLNRSTERTEDMANQSVAKCAKSELTLENSFKAPSLFILSLLILLLLPASSLSFLKPIHQLKAQANTAENSPNFPALATVTGNRLRVRTGSSLNHFAFTTILRNSKVVVSGEEGSWYRVHCPKYLRVWIAGDYVQKNADGSLSVTGQRVNIRVAPNTKYSAIGRVGSGQKLFPTGRTANSKGIDWVEVQGISSTFVYLSKKHTTLVNRIPSSRVAEIVATLNAPRINSVDPNGIAMNPNKEKVRTLTKQEIAAQRAKIKKMNAAQAAAENKKLRASSSLPIAQVLPANLVAIRDLVREERLGNPVEWDFSDVLTQLHSIVKNSEDLGEVEIAESWIAHVQTQLLPIRDLLVDLETKLKLADAGVSPTGSGGENSNGQIKPAVHKPKGNGQSEFLATGWIVAHKKRGKIDATHRLIKGSQLIYYLKSDTIDLNLYLNRRIGLQGTLQEIAPKFGAKLLIVTSVKLLSE